MPYTEPCKVQYGEHGKAAVLQDVSQAFPSTQPGARAWNRYFLALEHSDSLILAELFQAMAANARN